jgi:hypothetical protein
MRMLCCLLFLALVGCAKGQRSDIQNQAGVAPAEGDRTDRRASRYGVRTRVTFLTREREGLKPHNDLICMLAGMLPEEYEYSHIGRINVGKGTYGSQDEVLQAMANEARRIGVDAIIDLQSKSRHGIAPWRYSTPVSDGLLVKLKADSAPLDCEKAGGRQN